MDDLIAKLAEQKVKMQKQKQALMTPEPVPFTMPQDVETSSVNSVTPASDRFASTPTAGSCDASSGMPDAAEFLRLKQQLARAQEQIAHMGHELTQQRSIASTIEHAMGPPSEADVNLRAGEITEQTISQLQHALNSSMRPIGARQGGWTTQKDSRSDESGPVSAGVTGRDANIWSNMPRNGYQPESFTPFTQAGNPVWNGNNSRPFNNAPVTSAGPAQVYGSNTVNAPVPRYGPMPLRVDTSRAVNGYNNDPAQFHPPDFSMRRNNPPSRPGSAFDPRMNFYNAFPVGATPSDIRSVSPPATPLPFQAITGNMYPPHMPYQPRPIGTRLSPTAAEFHGEVVTNPWNAQVSLPLSSTLSPADRGNAAV